MKIAEFANLYNEYLPSIEQMKVRSLKFNSVVDELEIIERKNYLIFTYIIDKESDVMGEKLFQLIEKTNISKLDPGNIVFYNKIEKSSHVPQGLEFARQNDYQKICLDVRNSTIVWYNDESDDIEVIARDVDQFLLFLIESHKNKMDELFNVEFSKEESRASLKKLVSQGLSKAIVRDHISFY